jgi:hypothetical protein
MARKAGDSPIRAGKSGSDFAMWSNPPLNGEIRHSMA